MWICPNCKTENEDNFKFCWSCGRTREAAAPIEEKAVIKEISKNPEPIKAPVREIKSVEKLDVQPAQVVKPAEETGQVEVTKAEKRTAARNEPELFSSVLPYAAKSSAAANDSDWETVIFRSALRLVGLYLLYQVFASLPDLAVLIYSSVKTGAEFSDALTSDLIIPLAKILFYFIAGIYLIASGRILLWLLPGR